MLLYKCITISFFAVRFVYLGVLQISNLFNCVFWFISAQDLIVFVDRLERYFILLSINSVFIIILEARSGTYSMGLQLQQHVTNIFLSFYWVEILQPTYEQLSRYAFLRVKPSRDLFLVYTCISSFYRTDFKKFWIFKHGDKNRNKCFINLGRAPTSAL